MIRRSLAIVAIVGLSFGCSKKAAPAPEAAAAVEPAKANANPGEDNALVAAALEDISQKLKQQQYDSAVGSLVTMSQMPKSDAQQAKFTAQVRKTQDELLKRAQGGDQNAQQSVQMLGRMMTGR